MFNCFVCNLRCEFSTDLQNHMQRHRKADLISAVIKLPTDAQDTHNHEDDVHNANHNFNATASCSTHSPSSSCTSKCIANTKSKNIDAKEQKTATKGQQIKQVEIEEEIHDIDIDNTYKNLDGSIEINNNINMPNTSARKQNVNLRRSCRLKYIMSRADSDKDKDFITFESLEESYYMPPSDDNETKSYPFSDDSDDEVRHNRRKRTKKKTINKPEDKKNTTLEPVLSTPKVDKTPSSETDSCSGNPEKSSDKIFCSYCGSGYRTDSILADHIRHNHLNFCPTCDKNIPDARRFRDHLHKHQAKVFLCPYCTQEFTDRKLIMLHMQHHLDDGVIDDVLSLEDEYFSERSYMNTMYNMFNAGYMYGRRVPGAMTVSTAKLSNEFYQVFLQHTSDVERVAHYGYLCRTCGFTLFDRSLYRDHMQIAHGVTTSDIEHLLAI